MQVTYAWVLRLPAGRHCFLARRAAYPCRWHKPPDWVKIDSGARRAAQSTYLGSRGDYDVQEAASVETIKLNHVSPSGLAQRMAEILG